MTLSDQTPTVSAKVCATCGSEMAATARWCAHCVDLDSLPNAATPTIAVSPVRVAPARVDPAAVRNAPERITNYTGPPSYPSSGYPPPTYGPPAYGPPVHEPGAVTGSSTPWAALPWSTPQPVPRRKRWVVPTVVVGVLVAICVGVLVVRAAAPGSGGSSNAVATHTLTVPAAFGGYTLLTNQTALSFAADIRRDMTAVNPGDGALYSKAMVGVYATAETSSTRLVLLGFSGATDPAIERQITDGSPASVADEIMLGAQVPNETDFPTGPLGGVLRCGTPDSSTATSPVCVWADRSTVAIVIDATAGDVAGAAADTLALRSAAEH